MSKFVLTGVSQLAELELEQGFNTLGRNPTNDLRVRDATVSSFHCEIIRKDDSMTVRDLGSTNGTFVNGLRIVESPLEAGSLLRVGKVEFKIDRRDDDALPQIVVPKLSTQPSPSPTILPDGYAACLNHNTVYAAFECRSCHMKFCTDCVNFLRVSGGKTRVFCRSCSGHCDSIDLPTGVTQIPASRVKSVLGRLSQTIRIRFK
jgi:hypothetical protein